MKDSFILYTEQKAVIDKLSDEQAGKLFKAIYEYVATDEMPQLDNLLDLVIIPIKTALDKNKEKYEEVRRKRAEAGAKGGKQKVANQANASKCKQDVANQADNDNVNDNDNDNDINNIYPSTSVDEESSNQDQVGNNPPADFEILWELYPRKEGKSDAYKHYLSWLKGKKYLGKRKKLSNREMWFAIDKYKQECENKDPKYIKQGSTFFNSTIAEYVEMINSE